MKKRTLPAFSILALLIFLHATFFPTVSWALTGATIQPEFTGYESSAGSDMVNLITGDLAYSIPLVNVPGPEGGFSLPLSYHSGIKMEDEASWTGLGWALNPGLILRQVSQFPDDFVGEELDIDMFNSGGWSKYRNVFGLYEKSWDSEGNWGGSAGLFSIFRVGFGNQTGITALGVTFGKNNHTTVDPVGVVTSVMSVVTIGTSSAVTAAASASKAALAVGREVASSVVGSMVSSTAIASFTSGTSRVTNVNDWTVKTNRKFFGYDQRYWLDVGRTEYMLGSLYLGDTDYDQNNYSVQLPTTEALRQYNGNNDYAHIYYTNNSTSNPISVVSDMHSQFEGEYHTANPVTSIAYDNYQVFGLGASGRIQPYRPETGSLAAPGNWLTRSYNTVPFIKGYDVSYYKAQFIYSDEISNSYDYHLGTTGGFNTQAQIGMEWSQMATHSNPSIFSLSDASLYGDRYEDRSDQTMFWNKLVKGNHVEWFTQQEINDGTASTDGFIYAKKFSYQTDPQISPAASEKHKIGGFMITAKDGTTYHYSIPVDNTAMYTRSQETANSSNYNAVNNDNRFATAWLLTAITGSDYVDNNNNGEVDEGDWGYWVKLDYNRFSDDYRWRTPYSGYQTLPDNTYETYTSGVRNSWYLESISTRTHTALFLKDLRVDGRSTAGSPLSGNNRPSSVLKLSEVILLPNEHFKKLTDPTGSGGYGLSQDDGTFTSDVVGTDHPENIYDVKDFAALSTAAKDYVSQNQEQRLVFNYAADNASLCQGTANSFTSINTTPSVYYGKLTLTSLETYGKGNVKLVPDYQFEYDNSANYSNSNVDGWGMPCSNGSAYTPCANSGIWHLNRVTLPSGLKMELDYERDSYYSVSGKQNAFVLHCDMVRDKLISKLGHSLEDVFQPNDAITYILNYKYSSGNCSGTTVPLTLNLTVSSVSGSEVTVNEDISSLITDTEINPAHPACQNPMAYYYTDDNNIIEGHYPKLGGDVRVTRVDVIDENQQTNSTVYRYSHDGTANGLTSGVCAVEPSFLQAKQYDFYDFYDYSASPVMYKKVSVLSNYISETDYLKKSVFEFFTPHHRYITDSLFSSVNSAGVDHHTNFIDIRTSRVGRLRSINNYNAYSEWASGMAYTYADDSQYNGLGLLSEGSVLHEAGVILGQTTYHRIARTTKRYHPTIPQAVHYSDPAGTKTIVNTEYDFITGNVLATEYEDSWGAKFRTEMVPAYKVYDYMGSRIFGNSRKNMLTQSAADYLYSYDESGQPQAVSAEARTWNRNWNYRKFNATTGAYEDDSQSDAWRQQSHYRWLSALNADGTYQNFAEFDHSNLPANTSWEKTSEVTRYNHFSLAVEVYVALSDTWTTNRFDENAQNTFLSSANSKYLESVFTSFEEDRPASHFEDNLKKGANSAIETGIVHNGARALKLTGTAGAEALVVTSDKHTDFLSQIWVHKNGKDNFAMKAYKRLEGGGTSLLAQTTASNAVKAGDWYLVTLDIPVDGTNGQEIEIKIEDTNAGTDDVIVDDWKVVPYTSVNNTLVYDDRNRVVAELDDNHFTTKYEYDDRNRLVKVYVEVEDSQEYDGGFRPSRDYHYNIKGL